MSTTPPATVALARLKAGNKRFTDGDGTGLQADPARRAAMRHGQSPIAAVLTCTDSRVMPELLFDQRLGDLYVCRIVGNVASPESIASVEFAVSVLGVRLVVVLGHEHCDAISAAIEGRTRSTHMNRLFGRIRPAIAECNRDLECAVKSNVKSAASELVALSDILSRTDDLKVAPACYWLSDGRVSWLDEARDV